MHKHIKCFKKLNVIREKKLYNYILDLSFTNEYNFSGYTTVTTTVTYNSISFISLKLTYIGL